MPRAFAQATQPQAEWLKRGEAVRCYFHLVSGSEVIHDPEGVEVTDLDEARMQARKAIQDLAREDEAAAATWAGWQLSVNDEAGNVLFSISLDRGGDFQ